MKRPRLLLITTKLCEKEIEVASIYYFTPYPTARCCATHVTFPGSIWRLGRLVVLRTSIGALGNTIIICI